MPTVIPPHYIEHTRPRHLLALTVYAILVTALSIVLCSIPRTLLNTPSCPGNGDCPKVLQIVHTRGVPFTVFTEDYAKPGDLAAAEFHPWGLIGNTALVYFGTSIPLFTLKLYFERRRLKPDLKKAAKRPKRIS